VLIPGKGIDIQCGPELHRNSLLHKEAERHYRCHYYRPTDNYCIILHYNQRKHRIYGASHSAVKCDAVQVLLYNMLDKISGKV
jgi:hypothetical protein